MSIMAMEVSFDRQWQFWRVNMSPPRMPMVQVSFFVGIYSLYQCTAFEEATRLMSIMAMAGHGRRVSLLSCCLRGEGISRWFRFRSGERFSQKLSPVEKPTSIVRTTPLEKESFYPSVGNIPCSNRSPYVPTVRLRRNILSRAGLRDVYLDVSICHLRPCTTGPRGCGRVSVLSFRTDNDLRLPL